MTPGRALLLYGPDLLTVDAALAHALGPKQDTPAKDAA
jgi:hypothetical protein